LVELIEFVFGWTPERICLAACEKHKSRWLAGTVRRLHPTRARTFLRHQARNKARIPTAQTTTMIIETREITVDAIPPILSAARASNWPDMYFRGSGLPIRYINPPNKTPAINPAPMPFIFWMRAWPFTAFASVNCADLHS